MTITIPLTVVGGYLGAGKTTVINHLLTEAAGQRLAVIVNDFGELAIDAAQLAESVDLGDGLVSLPNGCICCSLGTGLMEALQALARLDPPPQHVLVEASGVADPSAVAAWSHTPPFEPGGVVVVAAADAIERQSADRLIGTEVRRQLAAAELILLTKLDVVDERGADAVFSFLAATQPQTPVLAVEHGWVMPQLVLGVAAAAVAAPPAATSHDPTTQYVTSSWVRRRPLDLDRLRRFLDGLDPGVLRLKGWVIDLDGATHDVHVVGPNRHTRPSPVDRADSRLVAIGTSEVSGDDLWSPLDD